MQEPRLLKNARRLRTNATPFEDLLWRHLSKSKLGGNKFRRQHVIDNCIVDFFCPAKNLIVEIDGDTHDPVRDAIRDQRHAAMGYATIRFTNADVGKNLNAVLQALLGRLCELNDRWPVSTLPHPAASRPPSPEGEGK